MNKTGFMILKKQKKICKHVMKENEELKAIIEKMKCCENCKHNISDDDYYEYCSSCTEQSLNWELKQ